ncbi:MAG: aminotransferase class V-fold PLP-dependent enzyme [Gemmatimonadales bacterium]|nr:aminotransferase class V-fold PLP-dependent enzyme [Gemmatimonadales bacterium]
MRHMVEAVTEQIVTYIQSLPDQPAARVEGGVELARSLVEDLPEEGAPFRSLIDLVFERAVPTGFNTAGPGYLAYIPGGGLFHSALADFIADAVNRYVGVWMAAPGLVQLEANVIRWFNQMVGFPPEAGGLLTSGGSLANFTAVVAARRERLPADFLAGTLYASDQVHHSVLKAAMLAGFPPENVRQVPVDDQFRIRLDALEDHIAADRTRGTGAQPFFLVGSAGTTNTGAVDDLAALASVAERERMWFHVDAAYGGFFMLTERGRSRFVGLERADSITLDPHKGLFLPYGTGSLLVRSLETLRRAHRVTADYMPALQDSNEFVDYCTVSPELSRDFRGLRVWLPLKMHGAAAFRTALDEKLDLTEWITEELRTIEELEIVAEPQLSIVAFALRSPGKGLNHGPEELNQRNRELLHRINAKQRVYLTGTQLGDRFVIRICVLSFRTHQDRMLAALDDIRRSVREVIARQPD